MWCGIGFQVIIQGKHAIDYVTQNLKLYDLTGNKINIQTK